MDFQDLYDSYAPWEDKMDAYREAKRLMLVRTIALAGIISVSVLVLLVFGTVAVMFFMR